MLTTSETNGSNRICQFTIREMDILFCLKIYLVGNHWHETHLV